MPVPSPTDPPPWGVLPYYQAPRTSIVATATFGQLVVKADPLRVVLALTNLGGATQYVTPAWDGTMTTQGIVLAAAIGTVILTAWDEGPMASLAYYNGGPSLDLWVCEISMMDWPTAGIADPIARIAAQQTAPRPRAKPAGGVIADLWRRLLGRAK